MRLRLSIGLAVPTVVGLAGCSDVDRVIEPLRVRQDVRMTPAEARADLDKQERDFTAILGGDAKNGLAITLHLDAGRTWLQTEGSCVPGDWKKASDDDIAHKRNQITRTPSLPPHPATGEAAATSQAATLAAGNTPTATSRAV